MCGIVGYWDRDGGSVCLESLKRAATAMRHRGPDDEGYLLVDTESGRVVECGGEDTDKRLGLPVIDEFFGEKFDLALGFRRLAIQDLSEDGHQPMAGTGRRRWIVYNGEVYNFLELRNELEGRGQRFKSRSDTEVILAAMETWGADSVERFNGMWAFALLDLNPGGKVTLTLSRDRFGIKPLHLVESGQKLVFGSEIKVVRELVREGLSPDLGSLYHFIVHGHVPWSTAEKTFFKEVRSLCPGTTVEVTRAGTTSKRYWDLFEIGEEPCGKDEAVDGVRELLEDAVRLRLRADVEVGSCLSGGVDSSSIVALVNRQLAECGEGTKQSTFSAVYTEEGPFNERDYIERLVESIDVSPNYVVPTGERLAADLDRLVWHQDEPFGTTSIFAQWCVMGLASECGVKVLLDGQAADELFAGYRPNLMYFRNLLAEGRVSEAISGARSIKKVTGSPVTRDLMLAVAGALVPGRLERAVVDGLKRRKLEQNGAAAGFSGDFMERCQSSEGAEALIGLRAGITLHERDLERHLKMLVQEANLGELLRYEDRNSMAFSVEARVPFTDYRLVDFAFRKCRGWKMHDGWTKWVLRQAMDGSVLDDVLWRTDKVGFETPEVGMLQRLLAEREDLGDVPSCLDGVVDANFYRGMVDGVRSGTWSGGTKLAWRWINVALWAKDGLKRGVI